jgi:hypothetical protein
MNKFSMTHNRWVQFFNGVGGIGSWLWIQPGLVIGGRVSHPQLPLRAGCDEPRPRGEKKKRAPAGSLSPLSRPANARAGPRRSERTQGRRRLGTLSLELGRFPPPFLLPIVRRWRQALLSSGGSGPLRRWIWPSPTQIWASPMWISYSPT